MASELCRVVMDSSDPVALGRFWSGMIERPLEGHRGGEVKLPLCERVDFVLATARISKQGKNRLHFDLASASADHQAELVQRARMLGATSVDVGQGAVPWVVCADPEGNEFCVLEPRDEYLTNGRIAALVIDALDPRALATFWSHVSGLHVSREHHEYATVRRVTGFWLEFVRVSGPRNATSRLRLEISPAADGSIQAEATRLQANGAVVSHRDDGSAALTDPEGNEFCLTAR